jgi:hypothetical protein
MKNEIDYQGLDNLKDKIDALLKKGFELSEGLSVNEKYNIIKKVTIEGINKAILNLNNDVELKFTEQELKEKKEGLEKFVKQYLDEKFSEYEVTTWAEK